MRQIASDVLADGGGYERRIASRPRPENRVFLAIPIIAINAIVIRLMHVLVDAEVNLHIARHVKVRLGVVVLSRQLHPMIGFDPVRTAGLAQVCFPAPFHLYADDTRPKQASRNRGDISPFTSHFPFQANGTAINELLHPLPMNDDLGKRDFAIGAENHLKCRVCSRGIAIEFGGTLDIQQSGKHIHPINLIL